MAYLRAEEVGTSPSLHAATPPALACCVLSLNPSCRIVFRSQVLVPLRFLFLTCHFVALLATAFGLSYSASHITLVNPADPKTTAADNDEYNRVQRT